MTEKRVVQLHHMDVWDDGMRCGLGVPYLISYARSFDDVRDRYELEPQTWETGGPTLPSGVVTGTAPTAAEIAAHVVESEPWMVGFTLVQWTEKLFLDAIRLIKKQRPNITVVVGGPIATDCGPELLGDCPVDIMVRGYGERPFVAMLRGMAKDPPYALQKIPGVFFRAGDGWLGTPSDGTSAAVLPEVPSVYRQGLVDLGRVRKLHVEWSRGCPFACAYCSWGMGNRKLYFATHEQMVDDIRFARENGIKDVVLNCSAINFSAPKLKRYIDAMNEGDPEQEINFTAFMMYESFQPEQLELFGRARFRSLCMGLQTDEEEGREVVSRPRFDRKRFEWTVSEIAKVTRPGISMISGIPGDTLPKFRARLDYLLESLDCDVTVFPLQVPPGTPMWRERDELGIAPDEKRQYWVYETPSMSAADHLECVKHAAKRLDETRVHPRGFNRFSHGVSTTNDFFDGIRAHIRGGKTLVQLHDTKVFDGGVNVGLGVPFLISHARSRPRIQEKYVLEQRSWTMDFAERPQEASVKELARSILDDPPKVLGLSLQAWSAKFFLAVLAEVKRQNPDILAIVGGPSATDLGEKLFDDAPELDFVLTGFAEHAFSDFLEALASTEPLTDRERFGNIAGLYYRDEHGAVRRSTGTAPVLATLDDCGAPIQEGLVPSVSELDILNVEWTRGCPLACSFCTWPLGQRKLTRFSKEYIQRDIAWALGQGFQEILITDAAINFATKPLRALVEAIEAADPAQKIEFDAFLQYYCLDQEQSELLKRVRFKRLMLGLQTFEDDGLKALHRPKFDRAEFEQALDFVRPVRRPIVDLMTAVPGDTAEKIEKRLEYLLGLDCQISVFPLLALPGTAIHEKRDEYGLVVDPEFMYIVRSTPTLSETEYRTLLDGIQRRVDAGAPIELSGYRILDDAQGLTPEPQADPRPSSDALDQTVRALLRRLGKVSAALKAKLGISGLSRYHLDQVVRADARGVRIQLSDGNGKNVAIEAYEASVPASPQARGNHVAFVTLDDSDLGRMLCHVLARLDRGAGVDKVRLEVAR